MVTAKLSLIETTVSEYSVRMRYADKTDPTKALAWIDFCFPLGDLVHPDSRDGQPLGDPEKQYLGEIRLAVLRAARDLIGAEIQRLSALAGRNR